MIVLSLGAKLLPPQPVQSVARRNPAEGNLSESNGFRSPDRRDTKNNNPSRPIVQCVIHIHARFPPFPKQPPSRGIRESRSWIHSAQDPNSSLILFLPTRPDGFGRMGNVTFFVCHSFLERKFYHLEVPKFTTTHHQLALLKSSEPVVVDFAYTCVHGVSETSISEKKVH